MVYPMTYYKNSVQSAASASRRPMDSDSQSAGCWQVGAGGRTGVSASCSLDRAVRMAINAAREGGGVVTGAPSGRTGNDRVSGQP